MSSEVLCAKGKKDGEKKKGVAALYVCTELPVFSILTCIFFFDIGVSRVGNSFAGKSRQRGMSLTWPHSIASGLFPFPCWDLVVLLVVLPKRKRAEFIAGSLLAPIVLFLGPVY